MRQDTRAAETAPVADESAAEDSEEEFRGDATLEDLLSKFSSGKRDTATRADEVLAPTGFGRRKR